MHLKLKGELLAATAFSMAFVAPAWAQDSAEGTSGSGNDIIVTAQRIEQRLQDVPISITVLDQAKLANNNVQNLKDIAQYTPGLTVNNRNGSDSTVFTIRGFFQEQRTFSTVGVFFADVVAPRGSGASFGGDGAGPGALFDLQNVQVLKGPQGTLFGRNVTGGAVLIVPKKPTDEFEGYVEGSAGNYDMWRVQGVINLPISDTFRVRVGVDHMDRKGYLKNIGNFGDGKFADRDLGDVDYWTARVSAVADLTPDLENYMIASYTHTQSNGVIPKLLSANLSAPGVPVTAFGAGAVAQFARETAAGKWAVSSRLPDQASITETWQIINTTTWRASDSLTIKNIMSYGEFRGITNLDLFGNYFVAPGIAYGTETPAQVSGFAFTHSEPVSGYTNAQSSFVEELQFQGNLADGRLTWQAGGYLEINDPLGLSGVQTASFTACGNILTFTCTPNTTGSFSLSATKFKDYAIYGQASYDLTDQLKLTLGGRYTWDEMQTELHNLTSVFGNPANPSTVRFRCTNLRAPGFTTPGGPNPFTFDQRFTACVQNLEQKTSAPTWLVGLDYKPIDDVLLYAKWSRGYRQGGLAIFGPDPIQAYDKEVVDTYEVGTKANWRGPVPGSINISAFYNDFRDQQLQLGVACVNFNNDPNFVNCAGNATAINAGKSRMYGVEVEGGISPFEGFRIDFAYAYLNAKIKEITIPAAGSLPPYNSFTAPLTQPCAGELCDTIANSGPPHKLVLSAAYTLPLPESVGKLTIGGTYVYDARRRIVADGVITTVNGVRTTSGVGVAPESNVFNLNATWENIGGLPIDVTGFVTNITNEQVILQINDNTLRGFVSGTVGEPRMWGARVRYKFGQ